MGETVIVGYDGEEHSDRALDTAIGMVEAEGGRLIVVVAEEIPPAPYTSSADFGSLDPGLDPLGLPFTPPDLEHPLPAVQEIMDRARNRLDAAGVAGTCTWGIGDPAEVIVETAIQHDASRIVIGARHHRFFERLFSEDVDAAVRRATPCEVVLVE